MKKTHILGIAAAATVALMGSTAGAQTQWIKDKMSDQCSAASRDKIADATRENIEESVRRAEASIQAPASVVDLSCMSDLLGADVDVFSQDWGSMGGFNIDGMINDVVGGLKSGLEVQTLSSGVERAICDFAKEKFEGVTSGLTGSMDDITNGLTMPDFSDGFGLLNIGYNGSSTGGTTGGAAGSGSGGTSGTGTAGEDTSAVPESTSGGSSTESDIQSIWNSIGGDR